MTDYAPIATPAVIVNRPQPYMTQERCEITELLNHADSPHVSVALARVAPGVTTQLHALQVDERYVVQAGCGRIELHEHEVAEVRPGDIVMIPAGVSQRIRNTGEVDLEFLCVCTPRFAAAHYINLERDDTPELL